ncbi:MAG TPA: response regulator transcription factor [Acidothermaceae bacterium]|jgi:DNA-binding NarL/FixJ family response regulator|nr:response regulator transcription factor [Acidothermaceae bacterium]
MTVRVVLADDHPMVRYGIAAVLADSTEVEVVAEAQNGNELLALVAEHQPDVVLTDLSMPGMAGAEVITDLRRTHPEVATLVLTMHTDDESLFAAMRAGAQGYLVKGADRAELTRAILAVASGEAVYGPEVASKIVAFFTGAYSQYSAATFPELTDRERDVLRLVAQGRRNSEIAVELGLSDKTVRNHVSAVLLKLQVPDRTAAAIKAKDAGL